MCMMPTVVGTQRTKRACMRARRIIIPVKNGPQGSHTLWKKEPGTAEGICGCYACVRHSKRESSALNVTSCDVFGVELYSAVTPAEEVTLVCVWCREGGSAKGALLSCNSSEVSKVGMGDWAKCQYLNISRRKRDPVAPLKSLFR